MRNHNLHVHSSFSDGHYSIAQLKDLAVEQNIEVLGISDHAFSTKLPEDLQITNQLEEYLEYMKERKKNYLKNYSIDLKIGIEIDASRNYGIAPAGLPFEILNRFDYILLEYINTEYESWGYLDGRDISELVEICNKIEIPIGLAHNDLQKNFNGKEEWIAKTLSDYDIFLELNQSENNKNTRDGLNYYRHFSNKLIQSLINNEVKIVLGTDHHGKGKLNAWDDARSFAEELQLQIHEMVK